MFHRQAHVITVKEALGWSAVWATLGLSFSVFVYYGYENHWLGLGSSIDAVDGVINDGTTATVKYLTGYVVEKSLSVDNIFVIAMIFGFFAVPAIYQHRVLFWGILGALLMRGAMIALGATLIAEFHWILYVFGAFLIVTGIKMLVLKTDHSDPNQNIIVRLTRRFFPITSRFHGQHWHGPPPAGGQFARGSYGPKRAAGSLGRPAIGLRRSLVPPGLAPWPQAWGRCVGVWTCFNRNIFSLILKAN